MTQLLGSPTLRSDGRRALKTVESARASNRVFDAWDALGLLGTAAVLALIGTWGAVRANPGYNWLPEALFLFGVGGSLAVAAGSLALVRRRSLEAWRLPSTLARIWVDPPRDWHMFGLGFILAIPALALHTDVLMGDSDSARLVAATMYVERNGLGYLVDTQDNLLPHLTVGPLLTLGGIPAAKLFAVVSVQALAGAVAFLAWKLTRSAVPVVAAVVALLGFPLIWDRAALLPLYPLMLAFGCLGLYFAWRATVLRDRERVWAAIFAGACLVLSFEAHRIGQLFLFGTPFLLLTGRWRPVAHGLARVYLVVALLAIPRMVINFWEGGFERVLSNRVDYWITKGYLTEVQERFFGFPIRWDLPSYISHLAKNLSFVFASSGLVVLGLGLAGLILARGRGRTFALACVTAYVAAVLYRRVPLYPRYFSPLMVAAALGAGVAVNYLLRRSAALRAAAAVGCLALLVGASVAYVRTIDFVTRSQAKVHAGALPKLAAEIDDGKGVIGSRAGWLLFTSPKLKTYGGQFLSEREFVTYLTWPSDQEVIDVLRAHNIGWVLVIGRRRFEIGYHNKWLVSAYGKTVHDVERVATSPNFCEVRRIKRNVLYKLGPCPA